MKKYLLKVVKTDRYYLHRGKGTTPHKNAAAHYSEGTIEASPAIKEYIERGLIVLVEV